jgi:regulator of PEP synthase PpsR (kinase-PPPase family)
MAKQRKIVWVVSDGTGRTALDVLNAASYQFGDRDFEIKVVGDVSSADKVSDLIDRVVEESGMIVCTIVSGQLRRLIHRLCVDNHILAVDLFGPLITTLQKFLEKVPLETPGLSYKSNRDYFRMVDAVDFTIKHDDGRGMESAEKADIVLIGPSRVGKTPLAVYLGYMGWKVSNIPVVSGGSLPEFLDRIAFKVFCLTIDPVLLQKRRVDRIRKLGDPSIAGYTEIQSITEELEYCRKLSNNGEKWPLLDTSYRTVEDIAKEIIQLVSI